MIEINHSKIKESNRKKIIKLLLQKKEITKLEMSRILDISITTVSTNITELKKLGIVEDVRSLESTGGRKATSIKLNENCKYSIGIALTPKYIMISLINIKNEQIDNIKIKLKNENINQIIDIAKEDIENILQNNNIDISEKLLGVGISIPGTVDSKNGIIKNCYLLNIKNYNIKEQFEYLKVPVYVDNEANLSSYYEYLNRKDNVNNLLYVSITDGFGGGIIVNGEIYRGSNNSSGEIGHTKININGKKCKCGGNGCLEAYTSVNALIDEYNQKSKLKINDIEEFEELLKKNDKTAQKVLKDYIYILSSGISNLMMILDPNTIVIGGDINNILEKNIEYLKDNIYSNNSFADKAKCKIEITRFKEAYLAGAARMVIEEFLSLK